jgi:hypothetical protein
VKGAARRRTDWVRDIALQQMQAVETDPIEEGGDALPLSLPVTMS